MSMGIVRTSLKTLKQELVGRWHRRVHYVTDAANWSFKWDAHYIAQGLERRLHDRVPIITAPWALRHQVILFGNRGAFFSDLRKQLHPSNDLFLIWFHGDLATKDPVMERMFAQMPSALERVRKVIVSCQISRRVLMAHGVPGALIELIPLGVDLTRFRPSQPEERREIRAALDIPEEAFCIGSFQKDGVGWEAGDEPKWIKGPDLLIGLLERIRGVHPHLMVLLTGPARGYVKRHLERLGIPYRHYFLEDYLQIVRYYQALDLYAITSRVEGGPKALMESWACGVPVVSSRMGMPADWILDGQNGFLSEVGEVQQMAEQVITLMRDPLLRERIRTGGLESVRGLDWEWVAGQYHQLFLSCGVL
ncbi:MAG: glycosyltransferase [Magnetococcales bacterium]|nr:glycosyltransferase [Magnetococcales bacterium]NGZ05009.1 glycosyltransferase [Magnetococcales bacterium]